MSPLPLLRNREEYKGELSTYIGRRADLYQVVAPRRDKSCGRVAEKFGLRTWL